MNYLLAQAPLKYLTGSRNRQGVVRNPAPAVVKGSPELTRRLINQCANKHKYTSGVISFEKRISQAEERQIIKRFEAVAFAGLRDHQFQCLWIRHSHTRGGRTELHFLVPRLELTTNRALNINPPRFRNEGLYDSFRKIINHDFNFKDPSGIRLSPTEYERLTHKLSKLAAGRAAYNRSRYPISTQRSFAIINPFEPSHGTFSPGRGNPAVRANAPATQQTDRRTLATLDHAIGAFQQANRKLDIAGEELDRTVGEIQGPLSRSAARFQKAAANDKLFSKYGIPQTAPKISLNNLDREEWILDLAETYETIA